MSPPRRPDYSESHRSHIYRNNSRRARAQDEEITYYTLPAASPTHESHPSKSSFGDTASSPLTPTMSREPISPTRTNMPATGMSRKRSLIRPERHRIDENHPNYHYRQHAANMDTQPSTTGNDSLMEDIEADAANTETSGLRTSGDAESDITPPVKRPTRGHGAGPDDLTSNEKAGFASKSRGGNKLRRERVQKMSPEEKARQKALDTVKPPSLWNVYCAIITFWCPGFVLKCFGFQSKAQQRAWREKMGLISIILCIMACVGFLTFGFTAANVNGKCKGLITLADGSDVPTNSDKDLAWYFPCHAFNQDGSSSPNETVGPYFGYACHLQAEARTSFYDLRNAGDVYFTWDDIKNSSRNLMVYSGNVLDLDLLKWFNTTQVSVPSRFNALADTSSAANAAVRGRDATHSFQSSEDKKIAQCFEQIIKVGSVDTETVGCIASKVVLYVSLVFILSIVLVKFVLALIFQWFIASKYAASKTSQSSDPKKRQQQIEEWSDDIYRAPPRMAGDIGSSAAGSGSDRTSKRASVFLPTTSRFSNPYAAADRSSRVGRPQPTTMASQNSTAQLIPPNPMFRNQDSSRNSLLRTDITNDLDGHGPASFISELVVPQPPKEWEPYGFPLAHAILLVTAYSEGELGIRTTLDSIATTDYPNSHKTILVICDGIIKGEGEPRSTPEVVLERGSKRHNMAKVYAGFYDYGADSTINVNRQLRVPMVCIVKCGTPDEATHRKPGNRGKRDSQIILMSFLQKVMFDERMTELEFEIFNGFYQISGIFPDMYEVVLMVDADTKVFPDSLTHMVSAMVKDPEIMGLCGETKIANKRASFTSAIQVFEYFISHHSVKSFESIFGGVTCLPGCFSMYRIKAPKGGNYWVPILANPDVVEHYSDNVVDTLHKKNLLLLGEDRYLSTLMLRTFPKRKQVFVPQAVCKTQVPDSLWVLMSQRRRWINSTIHNLMELVLVRDLCGTFCFSMQFVVFIDLVSTLVLPAAIAFTFYVVIISIVRRPVQIIPLVLLALILGLPGVLIVITAHRWVYVLWMLIYLVSLPIWNFLLPTYAFWKFDDFSWGDTRKTAGEKTKKAGIEYEGEFDSSKITMKRWKEFEKERILRSNSSWVNSNVSLGKDNHRWQQHQYDDYADS
ncbi:hypothetical protein DID88_004980 [Monilinia fructigena]|uniref:chitin synthase n=1 Tax=Monilinia fructigena TaxID=38457 RepID=A0A395IRD4_9HELO|nr:hypothetical protein DID88_004980 [Monilinia fructigena]